MSDGGKGDKQRPTDYQAFASSYDRIFSGKPQRGSFVQDPATGKLIPKQEFVSDSTAAPYVMGDIQPYQSMVDGQMITSRSHHRQHLKQHGMIEIGNEIKHHMDQAKAPPKVDRAGIRRDLIETMRRKGIL